MTGVQTCALPIFTQDPGYAFRLSEGMKGLERSAAARGGLLGGAQMKAVEKYGQGMASQEYQNAYNRALTEYNANVARESTGYNRLAALAGIGQTATGQISGAAGSLGSNLGNLYYGAGTAAGGAQAAGYMGMANALSGGLSSYLNYTQNQNLLNALRQGGAGGGYYPYGGSALDVGNMS